MELKTPLYDCHVQCRGKIVPFAGYLLPVQYESGVITEHMAVRQAAGLFDVSHMGEVTLTGEDALLNVQRLVTNDCSQMYDGQVKYSPMCNETGGVVDDLLVYKLNQENYLLVINAANRLKDVEWIKNHLTGRVTFKDISEEVAQLALQGPKAKEIMLKLTEVSELPVKYYSFVEQGKVNGISCLISKTGYTGEEGYELYCKPEDAKNLWNALLETGREDGLIPCGLGARDTLRLEAAMPLYGHEMNDTISPLETGLGFAVKFGKGDFIGKSGMEARGELKRKRVGLRITGRGIAREECPVFFENKQIGITTSGTHCPYLGYPVAMALIESEYSITGTKLSIEVRGRKIEAEVTALPFYKR
ncbi:glycine cleavage system aminomethyltransferase GcvT [Anaerocolumna sp. AGMB13025]|uniref:glycine cleavage system aminomethyltransferase GcvT n=1 Tax=Anaerocolumna sp. AGMB13025 TaxID=3039116 RepID=UPI00241FD231|nr:glycine cleavage system aminomethyltransferase GcvT [Anaerocolumna sp. AGMB13025]WFR55279.1 glycine cleavage system aminomethyltransferase GcvT [Anaerocolumna sp. AGMB13025]